MSKRPISCSNVEDDGVAIGALFSPIHQICRKASHVVSCPELMYARLLANVIEGTAIGYMSSTQLQDVLQ